MKSRNLDNYMLLTDEYVTITNSLPIELQQQVLAYSLQHCDIYPKRKKCDGNQEVYQNENQWITFIDAFKFVSNRVIPIMDLIVTSDHSLKIVMKLQPEHVFQFTVGLNNLDNPNYSKYLKNFQVGTFCIAGGEVSITGTPKFDALVEFVFRELKPADFELQCLGQHNKNILEKPFMKDIPITLSKFFLYSTLDLYRWLLAQSLNIKSITILSIREHVAFSLDATKAFLASDNISHVSHVLEGLQINSHSFVELLDQYKPKLSYRIRDVSCKLDEDELYMLGSASAIDRYTVTTETLDYNNNPANIILNFQLLSNFKNIKELVIDLNELDKLIFRNKYIKKLTVISKIIMQCNFKGLTGLKFLTIGDFDFIPEISIDKESLDSIPTQITRLEFKSKLILLNFNETLNTITVPHLVRHFGCLSPLELTKFDFCHCICLNSFSIYDVSSVTETDPAWSLLPGGISALSLQCRDVISKDANIDISDLRNETITPQLYGVCLPKHLFCNINNNIRTLPEQELLVFLKFDRYPGTRSRIIYLKLSDSESKSANLIGEPLEREQLIDLGKKFEKGKIVASAAPFINFRIPQFIPELKDFEVDKSWKLKKHKVKVTFITDSLSSKVIYLHDAKSDNVDYDIRCLERSSKLEYLNNSGVNN